MAIAEAGTRIAIKNILFATDFSAAAEKALQFAGELSRRVGAKLYAVHVKEPPNYSLPPESWRTTEEATETQARALRQAILCDFPGVQSEVIVAEGKSWQVLASVAEGKNIDLVVIGTRGRTGVGKFLLGSQAEEILRHVPCPVLVFGPYVRVKGGEGAKLEKILYATDFGPHSQQAARYALSLAPEQGAHVTFLHVVEEPKACDLVNAAQLLESSQRRLQALAAEEGQLGAKPEFLVEQGPSAEKILEVAERVKADVIVLGVREPAGFPGAATHLPISVAHKVISQATCPVLAVRSRQQHAAATR